jgi:tetratricopeptide (TPR) repeat protein
MNTIVARDRPASADAEHPDRLRRLLQRYYEGKNQLRRGLCLLAAGQYDEALDALVAAQQANPNSLSLPAYLAAAYLGKSQFREAAQELAKEVARASDDVLNRVRHALASWRAGQSAAAMASLRDGIHDHPESAELHFQLATLLAATGETEEAEMRFTQTVTLDPHHAEGWIGLALCHGARGEGREAVRCLRRAQARNPHDARTALLLTQALQAAEDAPREPIRVVMPAAAEPENEPGVAELARLIGGDPDFVEGFLSLEPREVGEEVFALLAAALRQALERSPEHADLHYHCGSVLSRLGHTGEAIAALERALDLRPHFIKAMIQLAKLYRQSDRRAAARARLEEAIRLGAEYADVYLLLGHLYGEEGRLEPARSAYRRALTINPGYAAARDALRAVSA